ncbi:uncharacterized protein METZ01_LOCUS405826, partial [marine metagenome]
VADELLLVELLLALRIDTLPVEASFAAVAD